ncbi:hypothetical protein [Kaarinaea lacus]
MSQPLLLPSMSKKIVTVQTTPGARSKLDSLSRPLTVEMEVYFSCLIRLRVRFPDELKEELIPVEADDSQVKLYFSPIMTTHCNISEIRGRDPDTEYFPIQKPEKFTPKWLKLDYKNNQWQGEFGY